jgi:hypothetical protein
VFGKVSGLYLINVLIWNLQRGTEKNNEDNTNINLKKNRMGGVYWIHLAQDREYANELLSLMNYKGIS